MQVYPTLIANTPGAQLTRPQLSIAQDAEFISPTEFQVVLKGDLTFANGNELTSSDVVHSFTRMREIDDPNGPQSLLYNLVSVEATDDRTVVFHLNTPNDQTFEAVLTTPAAVIVDEEVFPVDSILDDASIVAAKPFAGQYSIDSYSQSQFMRLIPFAGYRGSQGEVVNDGVDITFFADATNLRLNIENGTLDVAHQTLTAADIESLSQNPDLNVVEGPGGETRFITFNFNTMPFGASQPDADPAKARAVRQAMAALIDREAIARDVYKDTYSPLYSYVAAGVSAATETLKESYGDGSGAPDPDQAAQILSDTGVATPVEINLQYNPDHYGENSGDEYAAIKTQLEASGLFTVNLQSTEWIQYNTDRVLDVYPVFQMGWWPDISDADNFLSPFFTSDSFLENHYDNAEVDSLIKEQIGITDPTERENALVRIQELVTEDLSTLPLLQGNQIAVTAKDVSGVVLDVGFRPLYASITTQS